MDSLFSSLPIALSVLGYLAYQDWRDGKFSKKESIDEVIEKMGGDMNHLRVHFNDDLTRILTEMQVDQKEVSKGIAQLLSSQSEILKYGIKCRKE